MSTQNEENQTRRKVAGARGRSRAKTKKNSLRLSSIVSVLPPAHHSRDSKYSPEKDLPKKSKYTSPQIEAAVA